MIIKGVKSPCEYCGARYECTNHFISIQIKDAPILSICDKCLFEKILNKKFEYSSKFLAFMKRKEKYEANKGFWRTIKDALI